jgi:UDP-glucose 4-epimerase
MKVVVTGGAGFIGANLCRALSDASGVSEVVAFDDLSTGSEHNLRGAGFDSVKLIEGTILDASALDDVVSGADAVVHLAARPSVPRSLADPMASHVVNATGTMEVLEAARRSGGPLVIFASSSSVYGANPTIPKHEMLPARPVSPYAASKLAAEAYVLAYQHSFGVPTIAFRFFNVFGPLQPAGHAYAAVVPAFIDAALAGRPLPVHGDGRQTRDFTFVDTVTAVLTDAILRKVTSDGPVNLALGTRHDLLTVITELEAILGRSLEREHLEPRAGDVRDSQADSALLHSLFPDVEATSLHDGLAKTVAWFRELG